jgi:hypothetical protein
MASAHDQTSGVPGGLAAGVWGNSKTRATTLVAQLSASRVRPPGRPWQGSGQSVSPVTYTP